MRVTLAMVWFAKKSWHVGQIHAISMPHVAKLDLAPINVNAARALGAMVISAKKLTHVRVMCIHAILMRNASTLVLASILVNVIKALKVRVRHVVRLMVAIQARAVDMPLVPEVVPASLRVHVMTDTAELVWSAWRSMLLPPIPATRTLLAPKPDPIRNNALVTLDTEVMERLVRKLMVVSAIPVTSTPTVPKMGLAPMLATASRVIRAMA
jgi:hypothetical protein